MKHKYKFSRYLILFMLIVFMMPATSVYAWTDEAHMAMGLAAGFTRFQNCTSADLSHTVAKINGLTQTDEQAHFFNVPADYEMTIDDAYNQLQSIGQSRQDCPDGYLLGAILQAARLCKEKTAEGAYDDEYYAVLLHYVADLAVPLHMSVYDDFNRSNHFACDDILSDKTAQYPVMAAINLADELTVDNNLFFETEEEMLEAVIDLGKQSQKLAILMRNEQRNITREEALQQLSQAATLGRAIMKYCGKIDRDDQSIDHSLKQEMMNHQEDHDDLNDLNDLNDHQNDGINPDVIVCIIIGLLLLVAMVGILTLKNQRQ